MNPLIPIQELKPLLNQPNVVLLHCLGKSVHDSESGEDEYINGALIANMSVDFCDVTSPFPNTIPSAEQFELTCQKLGINQDSLIIIYDPYQITFAPRLFWLFHLFGHRNIKVLNAGIKEAKEEGVSVVSTPCIASMQGTFKASMDKNLIRFLAEMEENIKSQQELVVDVRSKGRFNGTSPEPRKGLRSGHIPNSMNIPYLNLMDNGWFKSEEELRKEIDSVLDEDKSIVFTCGSGITASIAYLAGRMCDIKKLSVYDGSWTEWATKHQS